MIEAQPTFGYEVNKLQLKCCRRCGIEKPTSEFYKEKRNKDGLHSYCKSCKNKLTELNELNRVKQFNENPVTVTEKQCNSCGLIKPASEFSLDRRNSTGLQGICKECGRKRYHEYSKTIDRREYRKKYNRDNRELIRMKKWLHRDKALGFLDADGCCLYCGKTNPFLLHNHHPFGKKEHPKFTIHLCANCHNLIHVFPHMLTDWL